ncbi:hypothetical protein GCM10011405_31620 [Rufibacter glacialis]|nr:hypothetical protein GCM10011405_31620 [Rufibacter glacialis]
MRHATAADKAIGQLDIDREISLLGQRQAGEAGLWLKDQKLQPDLILCSPAVRTQMTLENVVEQLGRKVPVQLEHDLYYGSESDLLSLLHGVAEEADTVLVIGHNPTISFFASDLAHEEVNFQPATIAHLHYNGFSWENLRANTCKLHGLYRE